MKNRIITHPGTAHVDDFLSCCLVLFKDSQIEQIERKEPSRDEIYNPFVWKLDVGNTFNPKIKAFDHHQFNGDDCTLSLLLKTWGEWETVQEIYPSIYFSVLMDTGGPQTVASRLGISLLIISQLSSCIENLMLDIFEKQKIIHNTDFLFNIMKKMGEVFFWKIQEYRNMLVLRTNLGEIHVVLFFSFLKEVLFYKPYYLKKDKHGDSHSSFLLDKISE